MLCLSQTTGYAILALACLNEVDGDWVKARHIGACTAIPMPYLSKILHQLGQAGLVVAKRGSFGGSTLAFPAKEISLLQVAEAVEGEAWMPKCLLGLADCSDERACPTHAFWSKERAKIEAKLARITVRDVTRFEQQNHDRQGSRCRIQVTAKGRR